MQEEVRMTEATKEDQDTSRRLRAIAAELASKLASAEAQNRELIAAGDAMANWIQFHAGSDKQELVAWSHAKTLST